MQSVSKWYLDQIHDGYAGFHATWPPATNGITVGSIVTIDDEGGIIHETTLAAEGITVLLKNSNVSDIKITSGNGIEINNTGEGAVSKATAVTKVHTSFTIDFKKDESVLFELTGCRLTEVANTADLRKQVLQKYEAKNWKKEWLIITQVITAASGTIIIAENANTSLHLTAKADVNLGRINLADASLDITVNSKGSGIHEYIAKNELSPLYKCMGLVKPFFGNTRLDTRELSVHNNDLQFQEIDPKQQSNRLEVDAKDF